MSEPSEPKTRADGGMTDFIRRPSFGKAVNLMALIAGLSGFMGAWFIIPYKIEQLEQRVSVLSSDHDLLIELRERCKSIERKVDRIAP